MGIPGNATRILVVDDHTTFAELLMGALDREPDLVSVGHARTAHEGVIACRTIEPDLVIMDLQLPDESGLAATERILAETPGTRIVILTAYATTEVLERAARLGACAILPKDGSLSIMLDTLRNARTGNLLIHPSLVAHLTTVAAGLTQAAPSLTPREHDVLERMGQGKNVSVIAKELNISLQTCRGYVKTILAKLDAHSQLEAVVTATRLHLLGGENHG